ncbi:GNAT family N-acetyltransferase [Sanguibacter sp. HDW7]|uniref:GNAT family N-acetyltransferase n=1 Tax=Sanguibacter sp. HDW7 TaxID=2714931 RepID=UPI00140748C8|nr:GNAT family protein [Sanguibacter sp. HDW7]QIK84650.1 GNAT family N-acetyltransferase [Sanguibacter sp. HDW7]
MLVTLRPWTPDDAAALLAARAGDPELDKQFGGSGPRTLEEHEAFIVAEMCVDPTSQVSLAIDVDGRAVGNVGVGAIEPRHNTGWMHYWTAVEARGAGLASRACASLARYAFEHLGVHRLELGHRVNNPASCRVAHRAGFAAEGLERHKLRYGTERFDVETHARLATDPDPDLAPIPILL